MIEIEIILRIVLQLINLQIYYLQVIQIGNQNNNVIINHKAEF